MTPILTDQQRKTAVTEFVTCRLNGKVKITDYSSLVSYLNDKNINMLCDLKNTGTMTVRDGSYGATKIIPSGKYTESDARLYFDWLMQVASGSADVSKKLEWKAIDQLFSLLFIMREEIQMAKDVQLIEPYDWQALLTSFDNRLTEMQKTIIKGENDIAETLSKILVWIKKYSPTLDAIEKERKELFGEGKKR